MTSQPQQITFQQWAERYESLKAAGLREAAYGGPLARHLADGDRRLTCLRFDDSPAALRLWNFLLTEEDRLREARAQGKRIVGAMKDLGTIPVLADSLPGLVAFYPDGAWWTPCVMEMSDGLFAAADDLGIDDSFCPVRALLGAFVLCDRFPLPDLLTCNVGAVCDDFSAIAQRLEGMGHPIVWWEMPHRRAPEAGEDAVDLPGGFRAPSVQVQWVQEELMRVRGALEALAGHRLTDAELARGIQAANRVRRLLDELRQLAYTIEPCPLPALEMLIAEMLALHFCSDREECEAVLEDLLAEVRGRVKAGVGVQSSGAVRVFWVNPVADLRAMNLLEECGGRICGTDYLFCHALDPIPENLPPMEALARMALADPMVGSASDRAERICRDAMRFGAEALVISRIPGASHCATEGEAIRDIVQERIGLPALDLEVPTICDAMAATLRTRLEALMELAQQRRRMGYQDSLNSLAGSPGSGSFED